MDLIKLLRSNELFAGLSNEQVEKLASIFEERTYKQGEVVFSQGEEGDRLFLVRAGFVEVVTRTGGSEGGERPIVNLGPGQSVGEIALIDKGSRSATVRAIGDETIIVSIARTAFENLCDSDTAIGYRIMRNIAADLSFKLRHQTLQRS